MSDVSRRYLKSIHKRFGYFGTWLPNSPVALGDVGFQDCGIFKRMTSLTDLGIPFDIRPSTDPIDFTYTSSSGLSSQIKLSGEISANSTLPLAQGGIIVEFMQEGALLFQAIGCLLEEIENRVTLGNMVLQAFRDGHWDLNWSVVDSIVRAGCTTILVANSKYGKLELSSEAPVDLTNLANANAKFSIHSQQGDILRFLAADGLVPLFRVSSIKQSIIASMLGRPTIRFGGKRSVARNSATDEEVLEPVQPIFD